MQKTINLTNSSPLNMAAFIFDACIFVYLMQVFYIYYFMYILQLYINHVLFYSYSIILKHWSSSGLRSLRFSPSAPLMTPLSSSWSSQMTPYLSASSRTYLSRPTHHHGQHCNSSGVVQIPGHHHLSGPEVGQSHWVHCENGPAEVVLPLPAEKFQSATGAAETVLLGHHRVCSLHFNNCLLQLSYKLRHQKNGSDCLTDYRCPPLQELYTSRVRKRAQKITLDPSHPSHLLFELLSSGRRYRASNTRTARHKNSFFPQTISLMNS